MNGHAHKTLGALTGPAVGISLSVKAHRRPRAAEALGWVAGGVVGAKLPDIIEPAHNPHHRKFAHSAIVLQGNVAILRSCELQCSIQWLHDAADRQRAKTGESPLVDFLRELFALFLEFLAGVLPGVTAGYASHLFADWTTPKRIPLY
jgi:membrane-bound metal-dependent hydrolase YbcI (DUF457 family)